MRKLATTLTLAILAWGSVALARPVARVGDPLFENSGFEKGDLSNWTAEGNAFKLQPVKRKDFRPHGEFCIATGEKNTGEAGTPEGTTPFRQRAP